jgi:hypothetical protein
LSATVTQRHWKKSAALYCALVLRPDLDRKELKKLAQKILALGDKEAGMLKNLRLERRTLNLGGFSPYDLIFVE